MWCIYPVRKMKMAHLPLYMQNCAQVLNTQISNNHPLQIINNFKMDFVTNARVLNKLPRYIPYMCVVPYIEPGFLNCKFDNHTAQYAYSNWGTRRYRCEGNYSDKYEVAVDEEGYEISKNVTINLSNKRLMLSRIPKKNGKHRYYLTLETSYSEYTGCDCGSYDCRDSSCMETISTREYKSKYVGNDFKEAVMKWIEFPDCYYYREKEKKKAPTTIYGGGYALFHENSNKYDESPNAEW